MPFVWLRDHCLSEKCYNAPTNQRKSNCADLFSRAKIKDKEQVTVREHSSFCIDWDDGHRSTFELADILPKALRKKAPELGEIVRLWNSKLDKIPTISKYEMMRSSKIDLFFSSSLELKEFSEKLVKFGVVVIEGIEGTPKATENLCKSLVPVHDTFFGQFWVFSNSVSEVWIYILSNNSETFNSVSGWTCVWRYCLRKRWNRATYRRDILQPGSRNSSLPLSATCENRRGYCNGRCVFLCEQVEERKSGNVWNTLQHECEVSIYNSAHY